MIARAVGETDIALSSMVAEIEQDANDAPKSFLSLESFLNLVFALLLFIYSQHLSTESEKRIIAQISSIESVLVKSLSEINSSKSDKIYYIVRRPVNLRSTPSAKKNNIMSILYPNQTTVLVDQKGKWIKVQYFDRTAGVHFEGWCYKKYLKRIK